MVPPQDLSYRPRRNRRSSTVREAFRETILTPANFIYPIFVHDDSDEDGGGDARMADVAAGGATPAATAGCVAEFSEDFSAAAAAGK